MSNSPNAPTDRRVLVVGSVNRDYVCRVGSIPRSGETVLGGRLSIGSGGKGGNQAVASALLGAPTALVGCVGDDSDGRALLADLATAGVDTSGVRTVQGVRTGVAFVMVDDDGANAIVVAAGANALLDPRRAREAVAEWVGEGDLVVVQSEIPVDAVVAAVEEAQRRSARVVLNLAPYRDLPAVAVAVADPLVVNEHEARALLRRAGDGCEATDMAQRLGSLARSAVVTCGPAGAVVASGGRLDWVGAPAVRAVDTTGAGDAFTGALAAALSRGADLLAAVRLGVAAGSFAVGRAGAQASYPTPGELPAIS